VNNPLHAWTLQPAEARQLQLSLRQRLRLVWDGRPVATVGGVDVSIQASQARAAVVVLRYPDLQLLEAVTAEAPLVFPYIPGLLSFREGPAILAAWRLLTRQPDVLLFDGQGIAHPRGLGIAAHMGLWLERPTIGVAKSRLYGRHVEPGPKPGDQAPLLTPGQPPQVIGAVLRSRLGSKPLYVSPGHLMDVAHSVQFVLNCLGRYRLPEPTRLAHLAAAGRL
jgi:deoxyribonuclease V